MYGMLFNMLVFKDVIGTHKTYIVKYMKNAPSNIFLASIYTYIESQRFY